MRFSTVVATSLTLLAASCFAAEASSGGSESLVARAKAGDVYNGGNGKWEPKECDQYGTCDNDSNEMPKHPKQPDEPEYPEHPKLPLHPKEPKQPTSPEHPEEPGCDENNKPSHPDQPKWPVRPFPPNFPNAPDNECDHGDDGSRRWPKKPDNCLDCDVLPPCDDGYLDVDVYGHGGKGGKPDVYRRQEGSNRHMRKRTVTFMNPWVDCQPAFYGKGGSGSLKSGRLSSMAGGQGMGKRTEDKPINGYVGGAQFKYANGTTGYTDEHGNVIPEDKLDGVVDPKYAGKITSNYDCSSCQGPPQPCQYDVKGIFVKGHSGCPGKTIPEYNNKDGACVTNSMNGSGPIPLIDGAIGNCADICVLSNTCPDKKTCTSSSNNAGNLVGSLLNLDVLNCLGLRLLAYK